MAWIDKNSGETAAALKTRLEGLGAYIAMSHAPSASSIAYCANGLILRQVQAVETVEYVGLTKDAAYLLATLSSDATTTTIYYHGLGSKTGSGSSATYSEYAACGVTTGAKTDYVASRANAADGWKVTATTTTYTAGATTGWTTTRPTAATTTGIETGRTPSSAYLFAYNNNPIYSTEQTITTEYRFLTKAEADTKVANNNTNNTVMGRWLYGTSTVYAYTWKGTVSSAVSRYIDHDNGYTVTVTTKTLGASGNNWSAK